MLKALLLAFTLCCAAIANAAAMAKAYDDDTLIDLGKFKAVVIAGTTSADGRFALGWTISPGKKGMKPVDWSLWSKDAGWHALLDKYNLRDESENPAYSLDFMVIDRRTKKTLDLPVDYNDARREISARWSAPQHGINHGLLEFEEHYSDQLYLINIDAKGGMTLVDPNDGIEEPVENALPAIPVDTPRAIWVPSDSADGALFHADTVDIPFVAELMNSDDNNDRTVSGVVTLRVADGKVAHVASYAADDLIQADPTLKKADAVLNTVYRTLAKNLTPAARDALKQEQRKWLESRDNAADQAGANAPASAAIRETSLLGSTRKRTAALQSRLAAAH